MSFFASAIASVSVTSKLGNQAQKVRAGGLAATIVFSLSCHSPMDPLPTGAVPLNPPPSVYTQWWQDVEICSGITRNVNDVVWFFVPEVDVFSVGSKQNIGGYWQPYRNAVTLAGFRVYDAGVVRHEMLHAILREPGHPPEYFGDKCAGIVAPAPDAG
ncbi:MAG TPA: hypothetical protein VD758_08885 [Gemmatimonadaceae bacterium]|nr:hypothetical protein [Gemmatimonadaceae bacterium]